MTTLTFERCNADYKNPMWVQDKNGKKYKVFLYEGRRCLQPSRMKRRFYMLDLYELDRFTVIDAPKKRKPMTPQQAAAKALKLLHPNAWRSGDLRATLLAVASGANVGGTSDTDMLINAKFRNITGIFRYYEMDTIRRAFEGDQSVGHTSQYLQNGTVYTCYRRSCGNRGRDFSVSINLYNDGSVQAWFSSEYAGCANGDYYLLLNPTTAIFYEKD